jgi:hypothetical protein
MNSDSTSQGHTSELTFCCSSFATRLIRTTFVIANYIARQKNRRMTLSPIFTAYAPRTSRALDVRGTRVIRPSDACTQESDTWIPTYKSSHCVRGTFVPRTSGPLHDAEIKMSLISALSVRHPSVFLTQQTHVPSVAHTLHA